MEKSIQVIRLTTEELAACQASVETILDKVGASLEQREPDKYQLLLSTRIKLNRLGMAHRPFLAV